MWFRWQEKVQQYFILYDFWYPRNFYRAILFCTLQVYSYLSNFTTHYANCREACKLFHMSFCCKSNKDKRDIYDRKNYSNALNSTVFGIQGISNHTIQSRTLQGYYYSLYRSNNVKKPSKIVRIISNLTLIKFALFSITVHFWWKVVLMILVETTFG